MTDILSQPSASANNGSKKGLLAPALNALSWRSDGFVQPNFLSTTKAVELEANRPRRTNLVQSKLTPCCLNNWAVISFGPCPDRTTDKPSGLVLTSAFWAWMFTLFCKSALAPVY